MRAACLVPGCELDHQALGLCKRHYDWVRRCEHVTWTPPPAVVLRPPPELVSVIDEARQAHRELRDTLRELS